MKKMDVVAILGLISLAYWLIDVLNNLLFLHTPLWSLWFSSIGIGFTAIALLTRSTFMLSSLFCALFVLEVFWNIGFFSHLLFHKSFMGMTDYLFDGHYSTKDFLITSYHILIIPFLLIGILKEKVVHKRAWIGAALFTVLVTSFTYFLGDHRDTTNCVHVIDNCRAFIFYLEPIANPWRTALGICIATVFLFVPTNYALVKLMGSQNYKSKISSSK